jgi:GT2 family glycosyltransferase
VVVVTWRGRGIVGACLDALAAQTRPHLLLVVDNASDDGTARVLASHPCAPRVLRLSRNRGYAGALAAALPSVTTRYLAWLNDDARPSPAWLASLEAALDSTPGAAAAGSVLALPDGRVQSAGVRLDPLGYGYDFAGPGRVFGFCGGAALLRADALRCAGGVPARFFCYYEDTDTAWRLRLAGHDVLSVPPARVVHEHGASSSIGSPLFHRWNERNRLLMLLRCAPLGVALKELARFLVITMKLAARRGQKPPNHTLALRLRVLAELALRCPSTLIQRAAIGRRSTVRRREVWRSWAGR